MCVVFFFNNEKKSGFETGSNLIPLRTTSSAVVPTGGALLLSDPLIALKKSIAFEEGKQLETLCVCEKTSFLTC